MSAYEKGDKVIARLDGIKGWSERVRSALNGKKGTITGVSLTDFYGHPRDSPYCVEFDEPAHPEEGIFTAIHAFWFSAKEIEKLSPPDRAKKVFY